MSVYQLLAAAWWSCAVLVSATYPPESDFSSGFVHRALRGQERREVQREILSVLGLPRRPRPHSPERLTAAPVYMLELYQADLTRADEPAATGYFHPIPPAFSPNPGFTDPEPPGPSRRDRRYLSDSDMVMSFVNLVNPDDAQHVFHQYHRFDLSRIPDGEAVTAAEFRVYKDFVHEQNENETFHVSVYQVLRENANRESDLFLLDSRVVWSAEQGWLVFDLTTTSNHWILHPTQNLGLLLTVENADGQTIKPNSAGLVGNRGSQSKQAFMVAFFRATGVRLRSVRSATGNKKQHGNRSKTPKNPAASSQEALRMAEAAENVSVDPKQGCKKHELYVSFRELGWQDWIIAPEGYAAYYCEGECAFPLNSYMNATNHAIVQTLVHFINPDSVPKPCCAPTQLHGISVLYFDDSSNVILKKYRNMVVRACGCH